MGKLRFQAEQRRAQGLRPQEGQSWHWGSSLPLPGHWEAGKVEVGTRAPHPSERWCSAGDKAGSVWGSPTGSRSDGTMITVCRALLSRSQDLCHLILVTTRRRFCRYPRFADEQTEAQGDWATCLRSHRTWTQTGHTPNPLHFTSSCDVSLSWQSP